MPAPALCTTAARWPVLQLRSWVSVEHGVRNNGSLCACVTLNSLNAIKHSSETNSCLNKLAVCHSIFASVAPLWARTAS